MTFLSLSFDFVCIMFASDIPVKVLQTFHHVKPHQGSPMKTSQLSVARGRPEARLSYDPRPPHLRKLAGYPDYVRNLVVNFQVFVSSI